VLRRLDSILAPISWIAAAVVVVMLLAGPAVVAQDKDNPSPTEAAGMKAYASGGGGGQRDGKTLFTGNCGSCHTLTKAGTSGQVGPPLDDIQTDRAAIERQVRDGGGAMPAFKGKLSDAEIKAIAAYVAGR
jgi:mono/diheme cytochrome c family protein